MKRLWPAFSQPLGFHIEAFGKEAFEEEERQCSKHLSP
jgi:hypothetical protein